MYYPNSQRSECRSRQPIGRAASSIALTLVLCVLASGPAFAAALSITPQAGVRYLTGDAKDLLGTGITFGGDLELRMAPQFALVGHGDFGVHPGKSAFGDLSGASSGDVIDSGASLVISVGGRFYPVPAENTGFEPFLSADLGLTSIAWKYKPEVVALYQAYAGPGFKDTDALGGFTVGAGGGARYFFTESVGIEAGLRAAVNVWASKTSNNEFSTSSFKGQSLDARGGLVIRLGR